MLITKEIEIDMAHRVCFHRSKCRNLHGHRYKIEVGVDDKLIEEVGASDYGMVIDFSDLKQIMIEEIDEKFDHGAVFYSKDLYRSKLEEMISLGDQNPEKLHFVGFMPTAENLCRYWFSLLLPKLEYRGIRLSHVKVWETPTSTAICTRQNDIDNPLVEEITFDMIPF